MRIRSFHAGSVSRQCMTYFVSHFRICLIYCRVLQLDLDASHRMFEFTKLIFYALGTAGTCITHPVLSMIGNYCKYFVNVPTNSLKMLTSSLTSQVFFAVLFCIIYHFFIFQMKQKWTVMVCWTQLQHLPTKACTFELQVGIFLNPKPHFFGSVLSLFLIPSSYFLLFVAGGGGIHLTWIVWLCVYLLWH